ncbi:RsmE family RNA methyltransferase [Weissella tructae]|uniref:Ribosomal RNA small subunit methyltransferase E n=2 Tax=Weissella TaxID=46255 RepID=A0A075TZA2_9LACO|nr:MULTISPECIES: RsmE family RNA methyltransferase [Weissella]AIG65233.1 Ribosomal RNA small subunit methyltransferase E [Weissella tructae]AIM62546.1 Ribosomal RNA small subunit methyltransferase E [Weissella ceti]AIM63882.1 Ribosomal RNA small subunit methyltransferase E [Weissella ceti]ELA07633.1 RsmE family RNA methyltransferase [Weissella ceti NC36]QVV91611.1 16S rRNA (uracil(1498)-N(3))-methyltransferase [Weissella tructae]
MQRYFLTEEPDAKTFVLPADIAHHFMTVLRGELESQAEFVLPDRQRVVVAQVIEIDGDETTMEILSERQSDVELPIATTLVLGLTKGDKPELVVQKATELGVTNIIFVETAWSVVRWGMKVDKKLARLNKIAQAAAEQSHRLHIPEVTYAPSIKALDLPAGERIVAWEESAKQGEKGQLVQTLQAMQPGMHLTAMVGPEGGLSPEELVQLQTLDFKPAGLGPRILRAETAPLYILSAVSYVLELEK